MNIPHCSVLAGLLVVLGGCEHAPPVAVHPVPASVQEPSLSQGARDQLTGKLDFEAMDRLLETLAPEDRGRFLSSFEDLEKAAAGHTDVETRDVTIIVRYGDADQQRLLDQAWAPFWSHLPPAVLSDASYPLPGRVLAATRRAQGSAIGGEEREP